MLQAVYSVKNSVLSTLWFQKLSSMRMQKMFQLIRAVVFILKKIWIFSILCSNRLLTSTVQFIRAVVFILKKIRIFSILCSNRLLTSTVQFIRAVVFILKKIRIFSNRLWNSTVQLKDAAFAKYMAKRTVSAGKEIQESEGTNLMVDYLPGDMQKNELYQLFKSFGQLYDLKIIRDPETGASHCCGFISYVNSMSANRALKAMNGCRLRGMKLKVSWSPIINADRHKIYVANLPLTYNAAKVRQIFERFGKVVYVNLLKNRHTHRSRGVAFVRYEMKDSIDRAILAGNNLVLEHGHPPLYVRLAYPSKVWPVSPEPDEPVPVPSNSAVETPSVAQPSTDTHVDSPKEEIKQSVNPKCFVFGQVDNATADATAASSLKPKTSLNYKYLMHFRSAPVAPALAASNESVDLAAIRDNVPEKAANGVSSVLTTGSNAAKIRIRRQLRFKIPYKRFVAIPKPDDI